MRMNEWHEMSIARAKPSRELSATRPCRSAAGAKAIECSTKSSRPQRSRIASNTASISPRLLDVERHRDRRRQLARQRLDVRARLVVEPGHGELGAAARGTCARSRRRCCARWRCRRPGLCGRASSDSDRVSISCSRCVLAAARACVPRVARRGAPASAARRLEHARMLASIARCCAVGSMRCTRGSASTRSSSVSRRSRSLRSASSTRQRLHRALRLVARDDLLLAGDAAHLVERQVRQQLAVVVEQLVRELQPRQR